MWQYRFENGHVISHPRQLAQVVIRKSGEHNTDHVRVIGELAGQPVITIEVRCHNALDQGLDHTQLYVGAVEVKVWTGAVVMAPNGVVFTRGQDGGTAVIIRYADGNEKVILIFTRAECYYLEQLWWEGDELYARSSDSEEKILVCLQSQI